LTAPRAARADPRPCGAALRRPADRATGPRAALRERATSRSPGVSPQFNHPRGRWERCAPPALRPRGPVPRGLRPALPWEAPLSLNAGCLTAPGPAEEANALIALFLMLVL